MVIEQTGGVGDRSAGQPIVSPHEEQGNATVQATPAQTSGTAANLPAALQRLPERRTGRVKASDALRVGPPPPDAAGGYSRAALSGTVYVVDENSPPVVREFLASTLSHNAYDSLEHLQRRAENHAKYHDAEVALLNDAMDRFNDPQQPLALQSTWLAHLERGAWTDDMFDPHDRVVLGDEADGIREPVKGSPFFGVTSRSVPAAQRRVRIPAGMQRLVAMVLRGDHGPLTFRDAQHGVLLAEVGKLIANRLRSQPAMARAQALREQRIAANRRNTLIMTTPLGVDLSADHCSRVLDSVGLPVANGLSASISDIVRVARYLAQQSGQSWHAPQLTEEEALVATIDLGMIAMRQGPVPESVGRSINELRGSLGLPRRKVAPVRVFTHSYGEIHVAVRLAAQGAGADDRAAIEAAAGEAQRRLDSYRATNRR